MGMFDDNYGNDQAFNGVAASASAMPYPMAQMNPMMQQNPMEEPKTSHPMYVQNGDKSFSQVVSDTYGTQPKGYAAWAPLVNNTVSNLIAYGVGGRPGLRGNLETQNKQNELQQEQNFYRQRMLENDPITKEAYQKALEKTGGRSPTNQEYMSTLKEVQDEKDLANISNSTQAYFHLSDNPTMQGYSDWDMQHQFASNYGRNMSLMELEKMKAGLGKSPEVRTVSKPNPAVEKEPELSKLSRSLFGFPKAPAPTIDESTRTDYLPPPGLGNAGSQPGAALPAPENNPPIPLGSRPLGQVSPYNSGVVSPEAQSAIKFILSKPERLTQANVNLLKSKYGLSDDYLIQQGVLRR